MSAGRAAGPGLALGAVGVALIVLAAAAGGWATETSVRDVAGVRVTDRTSISGLSLAPGVVLGGVAAVVAGVLLGVLRGSPRRLLAAATVALGLLIAVDALRVLSVLGSAATLLPVLVMVAGAALAALGLLAVARPGPARSLPARFDLEGPADAEWSSAVDPRDEPD